MNKFREYLLQEEKSALTVGKYIRDVRHFLEWLDQRELCKNHVLEYKAALLERYAVASANSMLSAVNCWLTYLRRRTAR